MDEALDLADYLPMFFKAPNEEEYISFLWESFETNYYSGKYQFAFLAYHMLMMSFVYFNIWQIREINSEEFKRGLGEITGSTENPLLEGASPFTFSVVREGAILQLFRLIGCDDTQIGNYRQLVQDRNDAAHANGNIYFQTQPEVDAKINQVLRAVEEIQTYFRPIISRCYEEFLLQSSDPRCEREFLDDKEQIDEVLIRSNYMSRKDIEFCVNFDVSVLEDDNKEAIEALHNVLCGAYGAENQDKQ